ncbi:hypothetical protein FRC09_016439 [Ceratobasidium sp. 395]|nr:hypothetical protein FRC09_016439 [Ceratobasidium sp. 395]
MPPQRISNDLRWAVVRLTALGNSSQYVAMASGLNERQVRGINQLFDETGVVNGNRNAPRPGRPRILGNRHRNYMMSRLEQHNDMFLDEIQADLYLAHGVDVSISTVWRQLRRDGVTRKKVDRRAIERCEWTRLNFRERFAENYRPEHAVFVDESAIDRRTTYRNYGYAPSGFRVPQRARFVRGTRYSMLPALTVDGILTLQVIVGSFTAELFHQFIKQLLSYMEPFPAPKSVIFMDNCLIHKWQVTLDMITER